MPFLLANDSIEIIVPAGQKICVTSYGAGTAKIETATEPRNYPIAFSLLTSITNSDYKSSAFTRETIVKITAGLCDVEYLSGVDPIPTIYRKPAIYSKKIIVIGSSVALGAGATNNQGWAYKLGQALSSKGYSYENVSIGGNTSQNVIDRFYTDLKPRNPDIVIIGLSLGNEGLSTAVDKNLVYNTYIKNIKQLVVMCRQQGYKVVVTGVYSRFDYTLTDYMFLKQADQELSSLDFPYINFLGTVDDGTGKWRAGMFADGLHPNDVGHEAMFRSFPLSMFDNLFSGTSYNLEVDQKNILSFGDTSGALPLLYQTENAYGSFTVSFRVRRKAAASAGKAIVSFENSLISYLPIRIRNQFDLFTLTHAGADLITSNKRSSDNDRPLLTVTYDYFTGTFSLYVDGVLNGSAIYITPYEINKISFGGRSDNLSFNIIDYEFNDFAIWRAALNSDQVKEVYCGNLIKSSLELYSPVVDSVVSIGSRLVNLAQTNTSILVNTANVSSINLKDVVLDETFEMLYSSGIKYPNDSTLQALKWVRSSLTSASVTLMSYIRKSAASNNDVTLFAIESTSAGERYRVHVHTTGALQVLDSSGNVVINSSFTAINDLNQHHIAIVLKSDSEPGEPIIFLYADGLLVGSSAVTAFSHDRYIFGSRSIAGNQAIGYEFRDMAISDVSYSQIHINNVVKNKKYKKVGMVILSSPYEATYSPNSYLENIVSSSNKLQWTGIVNLESALQITRILDAQLSPDAVNATATLTTTNLSKKIITSTTAAAVTATLPTGTLMDGAFGTVSDLAFNWTVINTGPNAFTLAVGTGHTIVGNAGVATNASGTFRSRRTGAATWVSYRIS